MICFVIAQQRQEENKGKRRVRLKIMLGGALRVLRTSHRGPGRWRNCFKVVGL